ncbi:hypothetical protein [Salipiger sp.]|uniref:hypothetical protein n=1 Tax=Salipiger sp. TaxID=2078585 RepID=UPI003A97181C
MKQTTIWLTASLALSACAVPGDFCDVVTSPKHFAAATARAMVATNRSEVEQIAVENDYGARHCRWMKEPDNGH